MSETTVPGLEGKVAVVTGGSRGIGLAIARGYVAAGARVVITGRKEESLEAAIAELPARERTALHGVAGHSAVPEDVARVFDAAAERFGPADIVVNNAATNPVMAPLAEVDLAVFDKIMNTNCRGYLGVAQEGARRMVAASRAGSIINVSTVAAYRPWMGLGAYSVSKAAVNAMTAVLAAELGPKGIRVNGIAPGLVRTRFSAALWQDPAAEEKVTRRLPLGRIAEPRDVVGAAVYLASDSAAYVTGQTLIVDGGMLVA